jgi:hypothetical protein
MFEGARVKMSQPLTSLNLDPRKVEQCINDLALLTLTNASDWIYRFFSKGDLGNPTGEDVIVFSHPSSQRSHSFTLDFGRESEQPKPDVEIMFAGSFALFEPLTNRAWSWIEEHIEEPIYFSRALVVEQRYAKQLAKSMRADGLQLA